MKRINYIELGCEKGLIALVADGKYVHYLIPDKKYSFADPEEKVRASYYVELIEKYQYSPLRIDIEVVVPRRTPSDYADIVVYKSDDKKDPFIVVECKKDGTSEAEFVQAVEQAFGNANSLSSEYAIVIAGNTRRAYQVKGFKPLERRDNIIADIPVLYGKVQEWRYLKGDPDWELQILDKQDLIRVLEKCNDTLWEGGKLEPTRAFDELCKIIFVKIRDEKKARKVGEPYEFQIKTHESPESVYSRIQSIYNEAKKKDPEVFNEDIKVNARRLFSVVNHLQGININGSDLDVKGMAFERFMEDFFKGKIGQYFTPREIVDFMVKMIQPGNEDIILDPACGSGGFLLHAMNHVRETASEFFSEDSTKHYVYWHDFAEKRLFGIEINDSIARVAKMNMIIHDDGHSNVIRSDALRPVSELKKQNSAFEYEKFDTILTNPPFGATIKEEESPYITEYKLAENKKSQSSEILFIERCFNFLKWETGLLAIVLPDGILNNTTGQYVRDFIIQRFQIMAIISLPPTAFTHYGAGVDSSLLFLKKRSEKQFSLFQASTLEIHNKNKEQYAPVFESLKTETKAILSKGCPAQVEVTNQYRPRFRAVLDSIEELRLQLGLKQSKRIQTIRDRFIREKSDLDVEKLNDKAALKAAGVKLKEYLDYLSTLEKEYRSEFDEAADLNWLEELKAQYKSRLEAAKDLLADKSAEDLREWIKSNLDDPIYCACPLAIGYDATGRKCENELPIVLSKYHEFLKCLAKGELKSFTSDPFGEIHDSPLIFYINHSDLSQRLDAFYYKPEFRKLDLFLDENFAIKKLGEFGRIFDGPFGSNLKNEEYVEDGIPLLRVQNIKNGKLLTDKDNTVFIHELKHNELKRSEVKPGDVVITKTGWLGNAAVIPSNVPVANIRADLAGVVFYENVDVTPQYLATFIDSPIGKKLCARMTSGSTRQRIVIKNIKQIKIPVPSSKFQESFVQEVAKRRMEAEKLQKKANEIFASADEKAAEMILSIERESESKKSRGKNN